MPLIRSLSGRLLIVTILAVMLIEVAIFVPSVARFREDYLRERVRRAEIAALTVLAAPDAMISPALERELIAKSEVLNIVVRREGKREMVLTSDELGPVMDSFDLRGAPVWDLIIDALYRIAAPRDGIIRVIAYAPEDMGKEMEVTLLTAPLKAEMRAYGLRILRLSLIISLITAGIILVAMRRLVVRPIAEVIENVDRFADNPEDAGRIIRPASRVSELAQAERALAAMQEEVHASLRARARLAALGEAVAKISHDLRNILATTQLMADRLETSQDPMVARTGPKLIASLDRAIRLCQSTLTFGKAEETRPEQRNVALRPLAEEVAEGLGIWPAHPVVQCTIDIADDVIALADPEHLYRVLSNLMRNASEALTPTGGGTLSVQARPDGDQVAIEIADTGPGMPAQAVAHLFKPFQGGTRREGTGLGLAIAHDLICANGGTLTLIESTTRGTRFRLTLAQG